MGNLSYEPNRADRHALEFPVRLRVADRQVLYGKAINISMTGMFLRLSGRAMVSSGIIAEFTLPGAQREFHVVCDIARVTPSGEVGIRFHSLTSSDRRFLSDYFEQIPAQASAVEELSRGELEYRQLMNG